MKSGFRVRRGFICVAIGLPLFCAPPVFAQSSISQPELTTTTGSSVVDAKGKFLGYLVGTNTVERNVNGVWVEFAVGLPGINNYQSFNLPYLYASSDCSGQQYLQPYNLQVFGYVVGTGTFYTNTGTLYFPAAPFKYVTIASANGAGTCQKVTPPNQSFVGLASSIPLPVFVLPFTPK
jgi:hypothetical protein